MPRWTSPEKVDTNIGGLDFPWFREQCSPMNPDSLAELKPRSDWSIALVIVLGRTYAEPGQRYVDPLGVARAHRRAGDEASALMHLRDHDEELGDDAQLELAALYARSGNWDKAATIWELLAARNVGLAMEKLAKYGEHKQHDFEGALRWTERMLALGHEPDLCERRRLRLRSKMDKCQPIVR